MNRRLLVALAVLGTLPVAAAAQVYSASASQPAIDRWMYPFGSSPGAEANAPVFAALHQPGFDERDAQFLLAFDTAPAIPAQAGELRYRVIAARVRVVVSNDQRFQYDPTFDAVTTSYLSTDLEYTPDQDPGKPIELFGVGFRNGELSLIHI